MPTDPLLIASRSWPGWAQRVFIEMKELRVKRNRMAMTMRNTPETAIDHEDRVLVQRQYDLMGELLAVLEERVKRIHGTHA